MDWVTGIQRALDYTEAHLTEELDYEAVAKQAYASSFHFQRMFSLLCGFSLGDYIRMRRLTLAARELLETRERVIDIALRYGYDTPESFSRAFVRFHGVTPSEARRKRQVIFEAVRKIDLIGRKHYGVQDREEGRVQAGMQGKTGEQAPWRDGRGGYFRFLGRLRQAGRHAGRLQVWQV